MKTIIWLQYCTRGRWVPCKLMLRIIVWLRSRTFWNHGRLTTRVHSFIWLISLLGSRFVERDICRVSWEGACLRSIGRWFRLIKVGSRAPRLSSHQSKWIITSLRTINWAATWVVRWRVNTKISYSWTHLCRLIRWRGKWSLWIKLTSTDNRSRTANITSRMLTNSSRKTKRKFKESKN